MREEQMTPESPVTISDRITSVTVTSGGVTFPLWIDYFDHWLKFFITVIYLTIALYALYKQVVRPIINHRRKAKRKQND